MLATEDKRLEVIHESPKGSKFRVQTDGNLYWVEMVNGGVRPDLCLQKFTSFRYAKAAMERYFANHPKPEPRKKSKVKAKTEDTTE